MELRTSTRDSAFELLRLFAMLLIVAHHFAIHGIFSTEVSNSELINTVWSAILLAFGKVGVHIFVIITGYFNVNKNFRFLKLFNIYFKTIFYASLLFVTFSLFKDKVNFMESCEYWFIKNYLILYMLTPFLNKLILFMSEKIRSVVLILSILLAFILPLFFRHFDFGHLGTFIVLYFIGACYQLKTVNLGRKFYILSTIASLVFLLFKILTHLNNVFSCVMKYFSMYSIFTLFIALGLFYCFSKIKVGNNLFLNSLAVSTFGIYLIHDNNLVRPFLWKDLLHVASYINSPYFIIYSVATILLVYFVCICIDKFLMSFLGFFVTFFRKIICHTCNKEAHHAD